MLLYTVKVTVKVLQYCTSNIAPSLLRSLRFHYSLPNSSIAAITYSKQQCAKYGNVQFTWLYMYNALEGINRREMKLLPFSFHLSYIGSDPASVCGSL